MTLELKMLALSIGLGLIQIVLASHASSRQRGYVWTASARGEPVPPLTGVAGRLERALHNFVETFPLFAAAVLMAHVAAKHSWMTEWGVQLYFWGRVTYLALYAAGIFLLRSLVWNVATLGIVLLLLSLI
ncbi:MAPEG family protein [Bradyrhizobium sp. SYSU BS000235]|uniref:MAPEG family protein n=1 Tax=Bradyrhizobium sp. SYSU BS000235 TaxID=3411332 RepID=UPI003C7161EE